ncbi:extracellular solute-binding protein [Paenibacillus cremeus]|uniref:Extracellular solute-binding protein n=1 Tax=Paenibacillus cremeus TaxID=2163881 RepID=A0A559KIS0_9BACL|nr:extracellular solute-binding protein [Paenibacillus cremeus]TVY12016.1 extracellular solute-binding protein [Paenibacillus cremeus]
MNYRSKSFKSTSLTLAAGMLVSFTVGCSQGASAPGTAKGGDASKGRVKVSMMFPLYSDPPQKAEVWKMAEDKFNMEYESMGVPDNSYTEKLAVTVASGDMPDAMVWTKYPDPEFDKLVKQGAFLQLDDLIKTSPNLQKIPQAIWDNIKVDGKIYGIPRPRALTRAAVIIRKDWLDNLGLPIPKTVDDIYKTAIKFTNDDPDKNGKKDTFGIVMGENVSHQDALWMAFDTGNGWRAMEDGTLMSADITPGRKQALDWLRKLYQEGGIDKDFAVLKNTQVWEKLESGKAGIMLGGQTSDFARYVDNLSKVDPKANLIMIEPPVGPTGKSGFGETTGFFGEIVIPAKLAKDKAKVKTIMDFLDYQASDEGYKISRFGLEGVHYTKNADGTLKLNSEKLKADGSPFINNAYDPYQYVVLSAPADVQKKQHDNLDMVKDKGIKNPAVSFLSPTASEKGTELGKFKDETFVNIVMGKTPIDSFDKFVADWKQKGGEQITKETNDWYKSQKK